MKELVDVTIKVPADRVGEFYELTGKWLSGNPIPLGVSTERSYAEWTVEDLELASEYVEKLTDVAKALFARIVAAGGAELDAQNLSDDLNIVKGRNGIAGIMSWPGKYAYAVGREHPVRYRETKDGHTLYSMRPEAIELFKKVLHV